MHKNMPGERKNPFGKIGGFFVAVFGKIKAALYSFSVSVHNLFRRRKTDASKRKSLTSRKRKELLFFIVLTAYPLLQFAVFYVGVNVNSILLAFKKFNPDTAGYYFIGTANFKEFLGDLRHSSAMITAVCNSLKLFVCNMVIALPLNLLFSYFLHKKVPLHGFFRVVLFLPQIISSLVVSLMFRYFVENALPTVLHMNLLANKSTGFGTMIFYYIWSSFGTQILIYTGAMDKIDPSIIEYGKINGISLWQEFRHVTLPLIFPTVTIFLVSGIAGYFTNQAGLFNFYGSSAREDMQTLGYVFFIKIIKADNASYARYPYAAAAGLLFTLIAAPVTILVKNLLEKYGPSEG